MAGECAHATIGTCDPEGLKLAMQGCLDASLTFPSRKAAFPLPPGYSAVQTPASPQQVQLAYDRCSTIKVGNYTVADASLGFAGVLVTAPDRGQPEATDIFVVELVTDSAPLASLFRAAGFLVANASASIVDSGPLRQVAVMGEVDYALMVQMDPEEGGEVSFAEVLHTESSWIAVETSCQYYRFVGTGQLTARAGVLVQAMPEAGPLVGVGSQSMVCNQAFTFSAQWPTTANYKSAHWNGRA